MISKFYRYRFLWITFLSLLTVIFIGNLYFKSIQEIQQLRKSRDDLVHKLHDIVKINKLMNNNINVPASDEKQIADKENNYIVSDNDVCTMIDETNATIKAVDIFSKFQFDADWVKRRQGIWQDDFENRFSNQIRNESWLPLKVFILPHSHTDPGWLQTFTSYYSTQTKKILDLVVEKLTEHEDMRFIWTEISFLDLWWEHATASQQKALTSLVKSGRLEIMTGGWVMTDEANVHLYAMLDQLIEGHQWVKSKFDVAPKIGWSIDPFGQGSTVPHLLAKSGFDGAIIQRIHYNWKEWLARHQFEEFYWKPLWDINMDYTLLTHNMPFDLYSTGKSCGPDEERCNQLNFYRSINGMAISNYQKLTDKNIQSYAEMVVEQYAKTASLFPHNVALVLVGDDFTYKSDDEFLQQYGNYKKLINFVNKNSKTMFNDTTMQFGTPSEYFNEITKRQKGIFPSLVGDFFPYADIFSSGSPAYWTGYFTTRPFYKLLSRNLEHNLRNAEILYSIAYNKARQSHLSYKEARRMEKDYELIVETRRNLGLFQHHDSITGTSKAYVMIDHLIRLQKSIKTSIDIQQQMIEFLLQRNRNRERNFIFYEFEAESGERMPEKKIIHVSKENQEQRIILFNSLTTKRIDVISLHVSETKVSVFDENGRTLLHQINPVIQDGKITEIRELLIPVVLSALSISVLKIVFNDNDPKERIAEVITDFMEEPFLENSKMRLIFNNTSGFLSRIYHKRLDKMLKTEMLISAYKSTITQSGAYLFKPESEVNILFKDFSQTRIIVIKGQIASDLTVMYGELLVQTIRIFNTGTYLDDAISVQNMIDFGSEDKNRDIEMIMKIKTSIDNTKSGIPEFFTDQNGFQWQPRRKVSRLGVEGNYYPITTGMFVQDDSVRLTLMTTHAQGATSYHKGEIEVMLDRRTAYDDGRGMGEGVLDSVKMQHKFWVTLEFFNGKSSHNASNYEVPSLFVHHLINSLNYPVNTFFVDNKIDIDLHHQIELFNYQFPCDTNLINLRSVTDSELNWLPSDSSLLILHRTGHDCQLLTENFSDFICSQKNNVHGIQIIKHTKIKQILKASLTGLRISNNVVSFQHNFIKPMEIKTYFVTYG